MDLPNKRTKQPIPIGVDDYKLMIEGNYLHIDKTLFIKEFWEMGSPVVLITRPRRFGKSITLSMLRYFFEKTDKSTTHLFEKSLVWQEEGLKALQGTLPVIFISFKDVKATSWEEAFQKLQSVLAKEVNRTLHSLEPKMSDIAKKQYQSLIAETANKTKFEDSLLFITEVIKTCLDQNTIILIDEYDAPITHAYIHNYYDEMIGFMRNLLSAALKGNVNLRRALMTGVVRTAKDGIMSGLNNPDIYTMLDAGYSDKFGFTEKEIDGLLQTINRSNKKEELRSWYNGYAIGSKHARTTKIYNPWSVLQYIKNDCIPETYWANTGSTELLERFIAEADEATQKELETIVEGKFLQDKQINEDVILLDLDKNHIEPWSFLFFAGYLTASDHVFRNNKHYYTLTIPNEEILELYRKLVIQAINKKFSSAKLEQLLQALIAGHIDALNRLLQEFISSLCSFHDLPHNDLERSLHMFVLGLLASLSDRYVIKSNLESGEGRYDILMHPKQKNDPAILIEFKKGKDQKLEKLAEQALKQITAKKYESFLKDFDYKGQVLCYGIATFKKHLVAKMNSFSFGL